MFDAGPRAKTADFNAGDIGYVKRNLGHYVENIGDTDLVFVGVFLLWPVGAVVLHSVTPGGSLGIGALVRAVSGSYRSAWQCRAISSATGPGSRPASAPARASAASASSSACNR